MLDLVEQRRRSPLIRAIRVSTRTRIRGGHSEAAVVGGGTCFSAGSPERKVPLRVEY